MPMLKLRAGVLPAILLVMLLLPAAALAQTPTRSMKLNQIRGSGWPAVAVNFNLRSLNNTPLGDIKPDQFVIEENGVAQQVTSVALAHDIGIPLSVVLVLDTSGSMQGPKLAAAQAAAAGFMDGLGAGDEVALLPFNSRVLPAIPFTTDKQKIADGLNSQVATGNTLLYDALYAAAQLVNTSKPDNRRAIVLLTDGQDTGSIHQLGFAVAAARTAGATVYTIGVGGDTSDRVMAAMSDPTGGRYAKAAGPDELKGIYQELARELAGQFLLTYKSTTHIAKAYETILVRMRYTTPAGEVLVQETRYRPPLAAVLPAEAIPTPTAVPIAQVPLPPGLPASAGVVTGPGSGSGPVAIDLSSRSTVGLIAAVLAGMAVLLVFGGVALLRAPTTVQTRLDRYVAEQDETGAPIVAPTPSFQARVIYPMFDQVGRRLNTLTPSSYLDQVQKLLYQVGPPYRITRMGFLGMQVGAGLGLMLLLLLWAVVNAPRAPGTWLLAALLGLFAGLYLPYFFLVRRATQRKKLLLRSLPAALDFLAIMVEAGMGFDAALNELVRRWQNSVTDEFALLLVDFQIGKPRRDAWRDLTVRTQLAELNSFVVAMMQSEQTGASIRSLLRTQAEQMRIRRRQRAEEEARIAPVKMLVPMGLFIFPCILIVILGPAMPQILTTFKNLAGH
jgi:tight adherence protein C